MKFSALVISTILSTLSINAHAATVTLSASDNGWYNSAGWHHSSNTNILTGMYLSYEYRHFLQFDLSSVSGLNIESAVLSYVAGNGDYSTQDTTESLAFYDYSGEVASLLDGSAADSAFLDLGSGSLYGESTVSTPLDYDSPMPEFSVNLFADAVTDINAILTSSSNDFVIGAASTSILYDPERIETMWANSYQKVAASLTLTYTETDAGIAVVPVPAAAWLFATGLMGLVGVARRKKQHKTTARA